LVDVICATATLTIFLARDRDIFGFGFFFLFCFFFCFLFFFCLKKKKMVGLICVCLNWMVAPLHDGTAFLGAPTVSAASLVPVLREEIVGGAIDLVAVVDHCERMGRRERAVARG
jgi:hypothetical protein